MATIRPDSLTNTITTPTLSSRALPASAILSKAPKPTATVPRIDYEPIYVQLRQAIGDREWQSYKESIGLFALGMPSRIAASAGVAETATENIAKDNC